MRRGFGAASVIVLIQTAGCAILGGVSGDVAPVETTPSSTSTGGSSTCVDGKKSGDETDVDCGGGACSGCAVGQLCKANGDCATAACQGGTCAVASCSDMSKNGTETER